VLRKWEDLIQWSAAEVKYKKGRHSSWEGVIKIILFIWHILDPNVMSFRQDPLVGIGIFYLAIMSQTFNRFRVVKWLTVIQQPILECNKYTVKEYILSISEHESTKLVSPVFFNLPAEVLPKVGNSENF
jgi:hypothetical protein